MIIDFTINKKDGHFPYYKHWCEKIDNKTLYTKKQVFLNFFNIINADRLIIPSANIADKYFFIYFVFFLIRIFLNKKKNHIITHTAKNSRLNFIKKILPTNNLNFYTFSKGLNDKLNSVGYKSTQVIFPNVEEFDVLESKVNIPFEKYIVIWGRSSRLLTDQSIKFLSKSSKKYVIINSKFKNNLSSNLFFYSTKSIKEDKYILTNSLCSLIIIDKFSRDYFKTFYGCSGILITNIYLNVFTIILGEIPSHSDEFGSFYKKLPTKISTKHFDNEISKIKANHKFDLNLPRFEDIFKKNEV